jgi:hypothetical protein
VLRTADPVGVGRAAAPAAPAPAPASGSLVDRLLQRRRSERLHIGSGFDQCGEIEDYRMAHSFLAGRFPLIEVGLRIDTARVAAERLIKTVWARNAVPKIAAALNERGVLSGDDVYALF